MLLNKKMNNEVYWISELFKDALATVELRLRTQLLDRVRCLGIQLTKKQRKESINPILTKRCNGLRIPKHVPELDRFVQ